MFITFFVALALGVTAGTAAFVDTRTIGNAHQAPGFVNVPGNSARVTEIGRANAAPVLSR